MSVGQLRDGSSPKGPVGGAVLVSWTEVLSWVLKMREVRRRID